MTRRCMKNGIGPYRATVTQNPIVRIPELHAFAYPYYEDVWYVVDTRTGIAVSKGKTLDEARREANAKYDSQAFLNRLSALPNVDTLPTMEELTVKKSA